MTAKSLWVAALATIALSASPALAGGDCGYGSHAGVPEVVADTNQSTPPEAETATSVPFPLPTLEEPTQTAAAETAPSSTE